MQTMVRRQADFENYRKRVERERQDDRRHGIGRLIEELLPVLDGLERGLQAHDDPAYEEYRKGLELIYRQLWEILSAPWPRAHRCRGEAVRSALPSGHRTRPVHRLSRGDRAGGFAGWVYLPWSRSPAQLGSRLFRPLGWQIFGCIAA